MGFGLVFEPFFEGLVETFNLALGLGVAGTAVLLGDAQGRDEGFEGVASATSAGEAGGVDHAVVGERGGGQAVLLRGVQEGIDYDGSGDFGVGGEVEQVAGVVVDEVQDLHAGAPGQGPVGEVGLPHFVGLGGGEAAQ